MIKEFQFYAPTQPSWPYDMSAAFRTQVENAASNNYYFDEFIQSITLRSIVCVPDPLPGFSYPFVNLSFFYRSTAVVGPASFASVRLTVGSVLSFDVPGGSINYADLGIVVDETNVDILTGQFFIWLIGLVGSNPKRVHP